MQDLWRRSAGDLAKAIAAREISSLDVVEAHLARIEAVNPQVNAVVRVLADEDRAAARVRLRSGRPEVGSVRRVIQPTWGISVTSRTTVAPSDLAFSVASSMSSTPT